MTLHDWLILAKKTEMAFGQEIGVSQTAVHRYRHGRIPRPEIILKIKSATNGAVTEMDWYSTKFLSGKHHPEVRPIRKLALAKKA